MKSRITPAGFSIIEVTVAIALLGILAISAGSLLTGVLRSQRNMIAIGQVEREGNYALSQMTQTLRNASALLTNPGAAGSTTISVNVARLSEEDPTIIALSGTAITLKKGINTPVLLTTNNVKVTGLLFTSSKVGAARGVIHIILTVDNTNVQGLPEQKFSKTFYSTVTIR